MGQQTTHPNQYQVEALMQIGGYLHEVRESKLLSLEQVSTQTMIQARLLRAIETADFHQLPEPIYIRGFIRRYAESLGLDGSDVASRFPVELDKRAIYPSWNQSTAQLRPTHLWLAYTLIIIVAIGGLHQYLTRFSSARNQPDNTTSSTVESQVESQSEADRTSTNTASTEEVLNDEETSSDSSPTSSNPDLAEGSDPSFTLPDEAADNPASDSPLQVTVELTQRSWLRVVVDGQKELEEVLPEGTQRTWTGEEQITIRAGNAGGVLLAQNDREPELMGDPGSVAELTLSVDDLGDTASNTADESGTNN